MFGKRSMGMRDSEVAPRTTMASDAMRMAMPLRMASSVSHMRRLSLRVAQDHVLSSRPWTPPPDYRVGGERPPLLPRAPPPACAPSAHVSAPARGRHRPNFLAGLDEVLALDDDLVAVPETGHHLDALAVGEAERHEHRLAHAVPH